MMTDPINFKKEIDFSKWLSEKINNKTITTYRYNKQTTPKSFCKITTKHNKKYGNVGRPDIICNTEEAIRLKWRILSNPFFIECKMQKQQIIYDFSQILRYKYHRGSQKHLDNEKYGDHHVIVTIPDWVFKGLSNDVSNWYPDAQMIRMLWHNGLGAMYNIGNCYEISFNEIEKMRVIL